MTTEATPALPLTTGDYVCHNRDDCAKAIDALKELAFSAETSGGTAGRDENLCTVIERARKILS